MIVVGRDDAGVGVQGHARCSTAIGRWIAREARRASSRAKLIKDGETDPPRARPAVAPSAGRGVPAIREDQRGCRFRAGWPRRGARSKRSARRSTQKFDGGHRDRAEDFRRAHGERGVAGAAPCIFRRARGRRRSPASRDKTPQRKIASVAVVGAGTMGGGIAMNFANAGIPVTLLEAKQEALDRGIGRHPQALRGRGGQGQAQARGGGQARGRSSLPRSTTPRRRKPTC